MKNKAVTQPQYEILDEHINILDLPMRIINALESDGVYTVKSLLNREQEDLFQLSNFNYKTVTTILNALAKFGFVASYRYKPGSDFQKQSSRRKKNDASTDEKDR